MNYHINIPLLIESILPPDKRFGNFQEFMDSLMVPTMGRTNDQFNLYIDGFTNNFAYYDSSITYSNGDIVIGPFDHYQNVYESQADNNTNQSVDDINYWINISPNPVGANERTVMYCSKLVFEYALNRWFGTQFRQPNSAGTSLSDIYITTNGYQSPLFYISPLDSNASQFGPTGSTGFISPDDTPGFYAQYQYTVHMSSAIYSSLPGYSGAGTADNYVRKQVDKYGCYGLDYNIELY